MPAAPAVALLALLWPVIAAATLPTTRAWPIDPAHSHARFTVRKFWITHAVGTFPSLSGTLHAITNPNGVERVRVDAALPVASLEMEDRGERAVALGPDFFNAGKFPTIRFDSDPFPMQELAAGGTLYGTLMLHGEQVPVTLKLRPSVCPQRPLTCPIRVRGTILRSAFGMRSLRGVLSNSVRLDLTILVDAGAAPLDESAGS